MDAHVEGTCDPAFGRVRDAFEASFSKGEVGAGVAVYVDGKRVAVRRFRARRHGLLGGRRPPAAGWSRSWARTAPACLFDRDRSTLVPDDALRLCKRADVVIG